MIKPGVELLSERLGDGSLVTRHSLYKVRLRMWLGAGEPVRWQQPLEPQPPEEDETTLTADVRVDRRSLIAGLFKGIQGMRVGIWGAGCASHRVRRLRQLCLRFLLSHSKRSCARALNPPPWQGRMMPGRPTRSSRHSGTPFASLTRSHGKRPARAAHDELRMSRYSVNPIRSTDQPIARSDIPIIRSPISR
jgi:hypothetical protein